MTEHQHHHEKDERNAGSMPSASKWAMIGFLIIAGYFLIMEHRAHVIQFLPFLLIIACPFLHSMHGGHGGHGGHSDQVERERGLEADDDESRREPHKH